MCWGLWDNRWDYNDVTMDLKPLLDDLKKGKKWYAEPFTHAYIQYGSTEYVINGAFRHVNCARVSLIGGEGFVGLRCSKCSSIPTESDFRMRVYRSKKTKRGERNFKRGVRLGYYGRLEIIKLAQSSRKEAKSLRSNLWRARVRVATLSVKVRSLRESSAEYHGRGDVKAFCHNIIAAHNHGKFEG